MNEEARTIMKGMQLMARGLCRDHHTKQVIKWGHLRCTYYPDSDSYIWKLGQHVAQTLNQRQVISLINIEIGDNAEARNSAKVEIF